MISCFLGFSEEVGQAAVKIVCSRMSEATLVFDDYLLYVVFQWVKRGRPEFDVMVGFKREFGWFNEIGRIRGIEMITRLLLFSFVERQICCCASS